MRQAQAGEDKSLNIERAKANAELEHAIRIQKQQAEPTLVSKTTAKDPRSSEADKRGVTTKCSRRWRRRVSFVASKSRIGDGLD